MFHAIQCTNVPPGASGSYMTTAKLSVAGGTPEIKSGGRTSPPSQVWTVGIAPPLENALLVSSNGAVFLLDGIGGAGGMRGSGA